MRKLFGEGAPVPPTEEVVKQLAEFGYKAERVAKWSSEKASVVLDAVKKESQIAVHRAVEKARSEGQVAPTPKPIGKPIPVLRLAAAAYLEKCKGSLELSEAVMYSVAQLDNGEVRRLAGYLIKLFRDNDGRCPDLIRRAAEEAGGARGETGPGQDDAAAHGAVPAGPAAGDRGAAAGHRAADG